MGNDEQAIRDLVDSWHRATKDGDARTVLDLMADDALFFTPGREPFGKDVFAEAARAQRDMHIEGSSEIEELEVAGDWAWLRSRITVTMTPPDGEPQQRSGHALTIFRRQDGRWVLARDANLMSAADQPH